MAPYRVLARRTTKIALDLAQILDGTNPAIGARAAGCSVALKRADIRNLRWIFMVECGNGPKAVKLKGFRRRNSTRLVKMDLDTACSCKFTRWQGPEHHSKREDYLDGKPTGTASVPVIRDPEMINRVCKHVYSVLDHVRDWNVSKRKK